MKNAQLFLLGLVTLTSLFIMSCEPTIEPPSSQSADDSMLEKDNLRTEFGQILAKALNNYDVRRFIKSEAIEMFDNDHDVLFQLVKNKPINDVETFEVALMKYASSKERFKYIVDNLPIVTILVPDLKNFSAKSWRIEEEIPLVAIQNSTHDERKNSKIETFNVRSEKQIMDTKIDPGQAVIVVKDNERVIAVDDSKARPGENDPKKLVLKGSRDSYYFIDNAYNGKLTKGARKVPYWGVEDKVLEATWSGVPVRDYVYFGIYPPNGINQGAINYSYAETITAIQFESEAALHYASDDWSEGYLDLYLDVIYFNDAGTEIPSLNRKVISASMSELADGSTMKQKTAYIGIATWDMSVHGDRWKVKVVEHDNGGVVTQSYTLTSTRASNFSVNIGGGEKIKIGVGFGSSSSTTITGTISINYTDSDDDLGITGEINYMSNVVVEFLDANQVPGYPGEAGVHTREYSTGSLKVTLEPHLGGS